MISEHTVHRHVANILRKLELPSRTAAAAHAARFGAARAGDPLVTLLAVTGPPKMARSGDAIAAGATYGRSMQSTERSPRDHEPRRGQVRGAGDVGARRLSRASQGRRCGSSGPVLVEACGIGPGMRVLDVAAGTGNVAIRAAEAGANVVASDLTPENFDPGARGEAAAPRGRPRLGRGGRRGAAVR